MAEFLSRLFDTSDFPARWTCGNWSDGHGWLHILSDLGVWSAYFAIPVVLAYFLSRRKDLPFRSLLVLFAAFILLCGMTHLMDATLFWWPAYRLSGVLKLATAVVSWTTVLALFRVVPAILAMRTPDELEREIAARRSAEQALRLANTDLEERVRLRTAALAESDRRKDEFIALLAHELRNPLAPIRTGLQLLRMTDDGTVRERSQEMMERQLSHMVRLVDDLLDASRIGRNKLELRRSAVTLSEVVASAVETARPLLDAGGHRLEVALPADPIRLDADVTRLGQVFSNLLNNAAKYTPPGGRITLSAARDGDAVRVSVRDTGIGIPSGALSAVFDMFSQVDRSIERTTGGLGIGLALVKGLTEMHGGSVEAFSDGPGEGSEFVVRLPVATENGPSVKTAGETATRRPAARRVLVVDDNRDGADSTAQMLRATGSDARAAYDGEAAISVAAEFRPDVVLLDIGLPGVSGYETCRRIRQLPGGADIAVVALTGWGTDEDRRKSADAGFDEHLVKPVDPLTLLAVLSRIAARR